MRSILKEKKYFRKILSLIAGVIFVFSFTNSFANSNENLFKFSHDELIESYSIASDGNSSHESKKDFSNKDERERGVELEDGESVLIKKEKVSLISMLMYWKNTCYNSKYVKLASYHETLYRPPVEA